MTDQHPITPPPDLVEQWRAASSNVPASLSTDPGSRRDYIDFIATQAAQWGADQELEACCEWLDEKTIINGSTALRAARRPKPPSLKEQALDELIAAERLYPADWSTIRRALEALDD
tara:strand:- start:123 stop:473 length:351 start_codon:yes stop_codon:yes gene_type:complete